HGRRSSTFATPTRNPTSSYRLSSRRSPQRLLAMPGPQSNEQGPALCRPRVEHLTSRSLPLALVDLKNDRRALLAGELGRPVSVSAWNRPGEANRQGVSVELINAQHRPVFVVRDAELFGFLGGVQLVGELLLSLSQIR